MIVEQIRKQMKDAMKAKRDLERDVLRVALGEIQIAEARKGEALTDDEAQKIVKKLIKSNGETIEATSSAETKQKLGEENRILDALLPKTLGSNEVAALLEPIAGELRSAKSDGQATGLAMKKLKTDGVAADGKIVADAVKQIRAVS
jgi:hypothetical protein